MPTLTPSQISAYARAAGFTDKTENLQAVLVAMAESSGRTDVVNGSGNVGLWQIGARGTRNDARVGLTTQQLKDPATNAHAARTIYLRDGRKWATSWASWTDGGVTKAARDLFGPGVQGLAGDAAAGVGAGANLAGTATGDVLNGAGGAIAQTVGDLQGGVLAQVGTVLSWLTTPAKWLRVVYVLGGGVLVVAGAVQLARPAVAPVAGAVKNVAKVVK